MDFEKFSRDGIGNIMGQESALRMEGYISRLKEILDPLTGEDWAEIKAVPTQVEGVTEEEEQAVYSAIEMLLSIRSASNNEKIVENLKRFARTSKILDVAVAVNFYRRKTLSHLTKHTGVITEATIGLYKALGEVSSPADVREAAQLTGEVINEEELDQAIERARNLNIT